jgi:hypothetical protein
MRQLEHQPTFDHSPMNHFLNQWRSRAQRKRGVVGFIAVLLCAATASHAELQKSGTFQGSWTATGTAQTLDLGESRSASILRLRGTIVTESAEGLTLALQSDCIGLNLRDDRTTGIGRCVWTDSDGDRVFSEVTGALSGMVSKLRGHFIGGTGKYAGLEGGYELEWRYIRAIEEENTIHGYSTSLTGSWKLP